LPRSLSLRLSAAFLFAVFVAACLPAAASAALPPGFFGVESQDAAFGAPSYRAAQLGRQSQSGITVLRQDFDWTWIEPSPGVYNAAWYDPIVGAAASNGIQLLPVVLRAPSFRTGQPQSAKGDWTPTDPATIGPVFKALVERYGPNGTFWAENPGIPKIPIRAWQVWNEPHLPSHWGPDAPNPAQYTQLLRAAHDAIKAADPGAEVVAAGISQSSLAGAIPLNDFIEGMYDAGAKGTFDDLAVHPYAAQPSDSLSLVGGVRSIMNAHGDGSGIWVTEFGWASGGPAGRYTTDEAGQAARVGQFVRQAVAERTALNLRGLVLYNWRDSSDPAISSNWTGHTGLLRADGSAKPALAAYASIARDASRSVPSGGGDRARASLPVAHSAQSAAARVELRRLMDGFVRRFRGVFDAPVAGRLSVRLWTGAARRGHRRSTGLLVATATARFAAAGRRTVRLHLTPRGRRWLLRHPGHSVLLRATFTDAVGVKTTLRRTVKLRD
jgi:hypothetical protein